VSTEKENVSNGEGTEFDDGCEPVACPNPQCKQELMDLDEDFWEHGNSDIDCRKCKQPAEHVSCMYSDKRPSKVFYVYTCAPCNIKFRRKIPAMSRKCPVCNEKFYMFWNLLLGLPGHSSKRPRRKAYLVQSA